MKNLNYLFILLISAISFVSCDDDDDDDSVGKTLVETFDVALNTMNEIPAVSGRYEMGMATMMLYSDNSLEFTIMVNNLAESDALTAAHIHMGDVVSTGDVLVGLVNGMDISFSENTAKGTVMLTQDQVNMLKGEYPKYVNVHSTEVPAGLVRGQIGEEITQAYNVSMSPMYEVPVVMGRNETGWAVLRVVGDMLYYNVTVENLAASDMITMAHIHEGMSNANGDVFLPLNVENMGTMQMLTLTAEQKTKLMNDYLYVNVHSNEVASGLLRGQIR